ncbi:metal ABC transporter solute-binding protein, Zn/Mn family [Microbacterium sp. Root180]|uniref:metal ABC transporter solute-binding protein, Zn/Mn family n=1 Tax=Microbacterium sp. Root180 TaxID=1736483 RepID=UPI0006FBE94F|nr:zinc ABC transporter substrate-binding protein [Microbacterium sp. Root180]KRB36936.1 metal ABC transporter substrate-binding protein [Microbacterium sp. Root180]
MTPLRRSLPLLGLAAASALVLAGCASGTAAGDDGTLSVVASTNVYGQVAEEIGGDLVEVTSIVTNESQDPHSFEASARDQLTMAKADLVIENGGGYDAFVDALIEASGSEAPVITAVEHSHDWPENDGHEEESADGDAHDDDLQDDDSHEDDHADDHDHDHVEGFNEHVWYDPHTIAHVADAIAAELSELDPTNAATYAANAEAFAAGIESVEAGLAEIDAAHSGAQAFATEPVPGYLLAAAGLEDVTPEAFSEAVEEGQDVPPATLLESLKVLDSGEVAVVATNAQTAGAETAQIVGEADGRGIPTVAFSETLPKGQTYLSWMQANVDALKDALDA